MKIKFLILAFLLLFPILPLYSQNTPQNRIIDNAGILSTGEANSLMTRLNSLSEKYNLDLVIVTESSIGSASAVNYADDFFDYNGYGKGADKDGCLLLLVTGTRDHHISTSGRAVKILNSSAFSKLESDALKYLRQNSYNAAFISFLDNWETFLDLDANKRSYNFFHRWNIVLVIAGWIFAFVIGFIVVFVWKKGMNTALAKTQADAYIVAGSLAFNAKTDKFLYSTVTKTAKPQSNSSSGGGIHTGSSGKIHGGGGGKF